MKRKNQDIASICISAVTQASGVALAVILIFAGVFHYQKKISTKQIEVERLEALLPQIKNSLLNEFLVGDQRSLNAVVADLKSRNQLSTLEMSKEPLFCEESSAASACLSGDFEGIGKRAYYRVSSSVILPGIFESIRSFGSISIFLLFMSALVGVSLHRKLKKSIVKPMEELALNPGSHLDETSQAARELKILSQRMQNYLHEREKLKSQSAKIEIASQVAHDIRAPLGALKMAISTASTFDEKTRSIIRNATTRVEDITNQLSSFRRTSTDKAIKSHLVSELVDQLVSEKRVQYKNRLNVEIVAAFSEDSGQLFIQTDSNQFARALSNIIDNSVESIDVQGSVTVRAESSSSQIALHIEDTGRGIPSSILPKISQRGFSYNKAKGSGLGLYSAKEFVESLGGRLAIESSLDQGTRVSLYIPRAKLPTWFVDKLHIRPGSMTVIVDDDVAIHQTSDERFSNQGIKVRHFWNADDFLSELSKSEELRSASLFLIDFDFRESVIKRISKVSQLIDRSVLVTSELSSQIISEAEKLNIQLLPKSLVGNVPLQVIPEKIDAILIDDLDSVRSMWEHEASTEQKTIATIPNLPAFLRLGISSKVPIFIDLKLADGVSGFDVAEVLHQRGYEYLYIATADHDQELPKKPGCVRGVFGKHFPKDFLNQLQSKDASLKSVKQSQSEESAHDVGKARSLSI